ncbi:hypothetical protein PO124_33200 [Bacillus licheniformis]|nr:hypothetical protein [Bacillus licheniformis]
MTVSPPKGSNPVSSTFFPISITPEYECKVQIPIQQMSEWVFEDVVTRLLHEKPKYLIALGSRFRSVICKRKAENSA